MKVLYCDMLMIRLARRGKKNKPFYRLVVSEKGRDLFGDALEIVGTYDPTTPAKTTNLDKDRILYWISKGAHASHTVYNLLVAGNVVSGTPIIKKRVKAKASPEAVVAKEDKAPAQNS